jgi:hypothetical protein
MIKLSGRTPWRIARKVDDIFSMTEGRDSVLYSLYNSLCVYFQPGGRDHLGSRLLAECCTEVIRNARR